MDQGLSMSSDHRRGEFDRWFRLGIMYFDRGEPNKAMRAYVKALEYCPILCPEGLPTNDPITEKMKRNLGI